MKITEINKLITKAFPISYKESWDEIGLRYLVGSNIEVTGILICLDLTNEVIETAVKNELNLIISHHPVFLKNKEHKPTPYELNMLKLLKQHKISFASYHTNVDNAPNGMNAYIARQLNLHNVKVIPSSGIATGRINFAYRPKVFASTIKSAFNLERILYTSEKPIKSVAIYAGAGFSVLKDNIKKLKDIDLLVTGDIKWHDWQYAKLHDIDIMDVGHDLENAFIDLITKLIIDNIKLIKIQSIKNEHGIKIVV